VSRCNEIVELRSYAESYFIDQNNELKGWYIAKESSVSLLKSNKTEKKKLDYGGQLLADDIINILKDQNQLSLTFGI
jgi:hypothetical protein